MKKQTKFIDSWFKKIFNIIRLSLLQFYRGNCFSSAASLAYTSLLTLVPLLAVSFFALTLIPPFKAISDTIQQFIFANFVTEAAQTVQQYFQQFIEQARHISIFGMLFFLIMAVLLVISMEQVFNNIWRVKKNRHGIVAFFMYAGIIIIVPILIGIGLVITSYLISLPILGIFIIKKDVLLYFPYFATFAAFAFLYVTLPNCKVPYGSALIATFVTTILFELAKQGFTFYVVKFANYKLIYGAWATIPIFLVWLYISWVIILFGAVVSHVVATYK